MLFYDYECFVNIFKHYVMVLCFKYHRAENARSSAARAKGSNGSKKENMARKTETKIKADHNTNKMPIPLECSYCLHWSLQYVVAIAVVVVDVFSPFNDRSL